MTESTNDSNNDTKRRKKGGGGGSGSINGFQSLGLSDEIYRGISKMGFRVSCFLLVVYNRCFVCWLPSLDVCFVFRFWLFCCCGS